MSEEDWTHLHSLHCTNSCRLIRLLSQTIFAFICITRTQPGDRMRPTRDRNTLQCQTTLQLQCSHGEIGTQYCLPSPFTIHRARSQSLHSSARDQDQSASLGDLTLVGIWSWKTKHGIQNQLSKTDSLFRWCRGYTANGGPRVIFVGFLMKLQTQPPRRVYGL